jgi:hypothetical protein
MFTFLTQASFVPGFGCSSTVDKIGEKAQKAPLLW